MKLRNCDTPRLNSPVLESFGTQSVMDDLFPDFSFSQLIFQCVANVKDVAGLMADNQDHQAQ